MLNAEDDRDQDRDYLVNNFSRPKLITAGNNQGRVMRISSKQVAVCQRVEKVNIIYSFIHSPLKPILVPYY